MPQQQMTCMGITSHHGSLFSRTMIILSCPVLVHLIVGAFMINQVHAFQQTMQTRNISGITTKGITSRFVRRSRQSCLWNHISIFGCPIHTQFDIGKLTLWNAIEVYHFPIDMWQRRFLPKEESATLHAMLQGNALYRQTPILINHLMFVG